MATINDIQIQKVIDVIIDMYGDCEVEFDSLRYEFAGGFEKEFEEGFGISMSWTCDEDDARVIGIQGYDLSTDEALEFDENSIQKIKDIIFELSYEDIQQSMYEDALRDGVMSYY